MMKMNGMELQRYPIIWPLSSLWICPCTVQYQLYLWCRLQVLRIMKLFIVVRLLYLLKLVPFQMRVWRTTRKRMRRKRNNKKLRRREKRRKKRSRRIENVWIICAKKIWFDAHLICCLADEVMMGGNGSM